MSATYLLLRGLTRECRHWGDLPARLAAVLGDAEIACVDLAGNGVLHRARSPATVDALMEECRARVRTLHAAPYRPVAMSLGAMVAVAWAARHPEEIAGAVLINTSLRPFAGLHRRLRPRNYGRLLRIAASADARHIERMILQMTSRAIAPKSTAGIAVIEQWARLRRECPVSRANAVRQLLAAARFRAPPAAPAIPLLLLAGARDGLVDPQCSRRIADAWRSPLHVYPEAGHDLPLDAPEWVVERIAEWARGLDPFRQERASVRGTSNE